MNIAKGGFAHHDRAECIALSGGALQLRRCVAYVGWVEHLRDPTTARRPVRYRRAGVAEATYFFTVVTERRRPIFRDSSVVGLFERALDKVRSRHLFTMDAFVILPDHLHTLWTLPDGDANFSMRWRLIKEAFTRSYLRAHPAPDRSETRRGKAEQGVWQRRFWEHLICNEADFAAHLDYIHLNPVHHGLVGAARDWPHSSFAAWVERGAYEPHRGSDIVPELPEVGKAA